MPKYLKPENVIAIFVVMLFIFSVFVLVEAFDQVDRRADCVVAEYEKNPNNRNIEDYCRAKIRQERRSE